MIPNQKQLDLICICGNDVTLPELFCSDRCRWIAEKMKSPMGAKMTLAKAFKFFGRQWDKKHPDSG